MNKWYILIAAVLEFLYLLKGIRKHTMFMVQMSWKAICLHYSLTFDSEMPLTKAFKLRSH